MSDWTKRDKSVDKAMKKIRAGFIVMNSIQAEGMKHILGMCWMDGNSLALRNQINHLEEHLSKDAE